MLTARKPQILTRHVVHLSIWSFLRSFRSQLNFSALGAQYVYNFAVLGYALATLRYAQNLKMGQAVYACFELGSQAIPLRLRSACLTRQERSGRTGSITELYGCVFSVLGRFLIAAVSASAVDGSDSSFVVPDRRPAPRLRDRERSHGR